MGSFPVGKMGAITEQALENTLKKATKTTGKKPSAMIINHCSNVTGYIQDMKMAADFAEKNNLLLIADISQSAGCIPVDVDAGMQMPLFLQGTKVFLESREQAGFISERAFP